MPGAGQGLSGCSRLSAAARLARCPPPRTPPRRSWGRCRSASACARRALQAPPPPPPLQAWAAGQEGGAGQTRAGCSAPAGAR
jgi:hypothetical protein